MSLIRITGNEITVDLDYGPYMPTRFVEETAYWMQAGYLPPGYNAEVIITPCTGFFYIHGQGFRSCYSCGKDLWEHDRLFIYGVPRDLTTFD